MSENFEKMLERRFNLIKRLGNAFRFNWNKFNFYSILNARCPQSLSFTTCFWLKIDRLREFYQEVLSSSTSFEYKFDFCCDNYQANMKCSSLEANKNLQKRTKERKGNIEKCDKSLPEEKGLAFTDPFQEL